MRKIIKYAAILFSALFLLTLNSYASSNIPNNSLIPENKTEEPVSIDINVNFEPYNCEELSRRSDLILMGTVKEILPPKWNTNDGKQPNKPFTEISPDKELIYTDNIISVEEYLKNPLSSKEIIVRVFGGNISNFSMNSDAEPTFKTSEKVLVFLNKDSNPATKNIGPEHFVITNNFRGKFTLTEDGKAITPDENTTLKELLSTINRTNSEIGSTETLNMTEAESKQEQNITLNPELKSSPFISSFGMLTILLWVFLLRKI